jgi:cyclic nucleotide-binding protein
VLFAAGDPSYDLIALLDGTVEISVVRDGRPRPIAAAGPRDFLAELNLLTGQRVYFTGVVTEAILEDSMLLNKGQDAITPIALPTGTNAVRFFSDQPAKLGVDTRDGKPMTKLNLNKSNAPVVPVPHDIHAFVARRLDDGSNDISVAFGT